MIVERRPDSLALYPQVAHARACGLLARSWGAFGEEVPDAVREAAAVHDDGWAEWDTRPGLDPVRGVPHAYSAMPPDAYREIWQRGTARGWERGDAVGLLVSLHGMRFFGRKTQPDDRALLEAERARQRDALVALGAEGTDPEEPGEPWARWSAWIAYWDGLSLFLCGEFGSPWTARVPGKRDLLEIRAHRVGSDGARQVRLDPFPFVREIEVTVRYRAVPPGPYPDQESLDRALGASGERILRCLVRPA